MKFSIFEVVFPHLSNIVEVCWRDLQRLSVLHGVINRATDGGIKPLHVAALKRHIERMQLLLDLGAFVAHITGRWNPN
ncbi:hypothetical protein F2Q68_00026896 [Brassica cretica]|uniref:Uncharacterized protein n=1 Tax=Brassica cretica TaxID=69181 RepID=A0A8S9II42_BRACR|nr:hypothetical protein F2Q68_00026896 [Brassica cretica]